MIQNNWGSHTQYYYYEISHIWIALPHPLLIKCNIMHRCRILFLLMFRDRSVIFIYCRTWNKSGKSPCFSGWQKRLFTHPLPLRRQFVCGSKLPMCLNMLREYWHSRAAHMHYRTSHSLSHTHVSILSAKGPWLQPRWADPVGGSNLGQTCEGVLLISWLHHTGVAALCTLFTQR